MSADRDRELVVRAVHAVARSLGEPIALPALTDERLSDRGLADEVAAAAIYHGVLPLLWEALDRADAPSALRTAVHDAYLPLVARDLRLQNLVTVVDQALTHAGVPYAVYKGPAVARHYRYPSQRMFSDIDLLVNRTDLGHCDAALQEAGLVGGWAGIPDDYAESGYHLPGIAALDLHWHVMREAKVRNSFALDTSVMLQRTRRISEAGFAACSLDDVDQLIAVATHACFDGGYRLGWLVDVARLMRAGAIDHSELRHRCLRSRTALPVQAVLDRTARTLSLEPLIPPLAHGQWRGFLNAVTRARPTERTFRQAGRGGLVFRATRTGTLRSIGALGANTVSEGLRPLLLDRNHRWRMVRNRRV
jgi:hypothetical protein